ncbi:MAG: alternative ribosome rescue aminoacyl-tRNA hydrolase ArfB [Lysobacterales bacterium]
MTVSELEILPGMLLPESELVERFVRSSGPGGQNVNKVSTAVELRFDVKNATTLPDWLKERVLGARDRRLTTEGVLVLQAQRFRTLERNRMDARERLLALLRAHTVEQKKRIATAPTRAAQRRRVDAKKARAGVKQLRSKRGLDE